jgi:membrane-associated PAP2 superfamily phosphatase
MPRKVAIVLDWVIPVVLLAAVTAVFFRTDLDVRIARHFYVPGEGFPTGAKPLWHWMKHYGTVPPLVIAIAALGVFLGSLFRPRMRPMRRSALFLSLVMLVGPGLIVNDTFKDHWGRPRPRDLVELGGKHEYVPPLVMSPREYGASFCSGTPPSRSICSRPTSCFAGARRGKQH